MPDPRACPRRSRIGAGAGLALGLLLAPLVLQPAPRLVWNASASSPVGLYAVSPTGTLRRGGMALAWPPPAARALGAQRGYLPGNVPLVKRIAAVAGDRVCARGAAILGEGRPVALRLRSDPAGRAMPWWSGCARLRPGEALLLSPGVPLAFDGRYFGPSRAAQVLGRASLLWPR